MKVVICLSDYDLVPSGLGGHYVSCRGGPENWTHVDLSTLASYEHEHDVIDHFVESLNTLTSFDVSVSSLVIGTMLVTFIIGFYTGKVVRILMKV